MIDFTCNHFELFGLPVAFRIDDDALDARYRALQADVHPDRHGAAGEAERRLAHQASARVNEAYRALKDPVARARHLLALRGVDAMDETDTRLPLPFLEAQLERRERAAEAADAEDIDALDALLAQIRTDQRDRLAGLAAHLAPGGSVEAARHAVRELTFLAKVAEDVEAMVEGIEA